MNNNKPENLVIPQEADMFGSETNETTTIVVLKSTRDLLARFGKKKESNDTILQRILKTHNPNPMSEAVVDNQGKALISMSVAGKTIQYRIKQ